MKPIIKKEHVKTLLDAKFLRVFDLQYAPEKHYYNASRRKLEDLVAVKSDEEFRQMLPDAVTCVVILMLPGEEPQLLLTNEYRYPTGQYLLSPPAGLLDAEDIGSETPLLSTALREIKEETGITVKDSDSVFVINPLLFSSPGMTDESNALVCAVIDLEDISSLSQTGAVGGELFDGFTLLTKEDATKILKQGRDENGVFYSIFAWAAMIYFVSDMWR